MEITTEAFLAAGGKFLVRLHEEDMHPSESFAGDDQEADAKAVADILHDLDSGNPWAWCCVEVVAKLDGNFSGSDFLGACSYKSEKDFKRDGYYTEMCKEALANLAKVLADTRQDGEEAEWRLEMLRRGGGK